MAINLDRLEHTFRDQVNTLLANCAGRGVIMRPYFGERHPVEQAKLWRQSRSREEIEAKIRELEKVAPYIAKCMHDAGPAHGPHVTNALPGQSWHQWGLAVDCFWYLNQEASWKTPAQEMLGARTQNGYHIYAEEAVKLKLTPGGHWKKFQDWPHVQQFAYEVHEQYDWAQVDAEMRNRFDRF